MFCRPIVRTMLSNLRSFATEASPLAILRKKTGYSLSNCRKALELHENDVIKAEAWLKEKAQELGWAQATKLGGRTTPQGLIGVILQKNIGSLIEVNCETDFVARSEKFHAFVEAASRACLKYVSALPDSEMISRTEFQGASLNNLMSSNNQKLSDELALVIGSVNENASLKRAVCFKVPDTVQLIGTAYPLQKPTTCADDEFQAGTMGTILGIRSPAELTEELKKNLCLQVIGSSPTKVGNKEHDKPVANIDDELCLIHQEYLFDPSIKVSELLEEQEIEVVDFQKYKCGESETQEDNVSAASAGN